MQSPSLGELSELPAVFSEYEKYTREYCGSCIAHELTKKRECVSISFYDFR